MTNADWIALTAVLYSAPRASGGPIGLRLSPPLFSALLLRGGNDEKALHVPVHLSPPVWDFREIQKIRSIHLKFAIHSGTPAKCLCAIED